MLAGGDAAPNPPPEADVAPTHTTLVVELPGMGDGPHPPPEADVAPTLCA
jgi:hypothetical protein